MPQHSPEWEDGYDAALDDVASYEGSTPNPFAPGTPSHDAWNAGYSAGLDFYEEEAVYEEEAYAEELDEDACCDWDDWDDEDEDDANERHCEQMCQEEYDAAYDEGRAAYEEGTVPYRNPYDDDITRGSAWTGWDDGYSDAVEDDNRRTEENR